MMNLPRRSRRNLFATTALAAALAAAPAQSASDLPIGGNVGGANHSSGFITTTVANGGAAGSLGGQSDGINNIPLAADPSKSAVTFTVKAAQNVVDWADFSIASGKSVTFTPGAGITKLLGTQSRHRRDGQQHRGHAVRRRRHDLAD